MNLRTVALSLVAVALSGCSTVTGTFTYKVLEPQKPSYGFGHLAQGVAADSLQPTLSWKPAATPGVTYDVIIYEVASSWSMSKGQDYTRGKQVYYREGLSGHEHKVEVTLKPNQIYQWSARTRSGTETSAWATVDWRGPPMDPFSWYKNHLWVFHTPRK